MCGMQWRWLQRGTPANWRNAASMTKWPLSQHADLLHAMDCKVMIYCEVAVMTPGSPLDAPMSQRLIMPAGEAAAYASHLTEFSKRLADEYVLQLAYHHHLW